MVPAHGEGDDALRMVARQRLSASPSRNKQHGPPVGEGGGPQCSSDQAAVADPGPGCAPLRATLMLRAPPLPACLASAAVLLKKAAGVETGSGEPNRKKVGTVTMDQVGLDP